MRLVDNLYFYFEDLNLLEKVFLDFNYFEDKIEIINIVPLTISFIFLSFFLFNKTNVNRIILLLSSLLLSGIFYTYLNHIKIDTYNKVKKDKIFNCIGSQARSFYITNEQIVCLRTELSNKELEPNKLNFIEQIFILNKEEIFKDLTKKTEYNIILIIIIFVIIFVISSYIITLIFGEYDRKKDFLIDGTTTNPQDYPKFAIIGLLVYLLSQIFLNSDNVNIKRLNAKVLEFNKEQLLEKKDFDNKEINKSPIEFILLKDIIKNEYKYIDIIEGRIDLILKLTLKDINIENFKEFIKNKDIENTYFGNILKYGFYENKNLALDNRIQLSKYYKEKSNELLFKEIKNNNSEFIKNNLSFFGLGKPGYNYLITNDINDLETSLYINSISLHDNNICDSINFKIENNFKILKINYSKKEIIKISEKYNCFNKHRTLKIN